MLVVDNFYSAGRSDIRLLNGNAFSVYNKNNKQKINSVMSEKKQQTVRCISKKCIIYPNSRKNGNVELKFGRVGQRNESCFGLKSMPYFFRCLDMYEMLLFQRLWMWGICEN